MLIELNKGFVKTDQRTELKNKNPELINSKISEVIRFLQTNKLCESTKMYVLGSIKRFYDKNMVNNDKNAEEIETFEEYVRILGENFKNLREKSKGKVKI